MDSKLTTCVPGVLTIGTDASSPGLFHFGEPGASDFSGFDVDLCTAIAERLDLSPRFADCLWSAAFEKLNRGTFDVVCTATTVTEARRAVVEFSVPYFDVEVAVVARRNGPVSTLDDLPGKRIGVRVATTAEEALRAYLKGGRVQTYDHNVDAYGDLSSNETDAVADDFPIAQYFVQHRPELRVAGILPGSASQYAIVLAKGNHGLRAELDRVITAFRADGFLDQLRQKWFAGERRP